LSIEEFDLIAWNASPHCMPGFPFNKNFINWTERNTTPWKMNYAKGVQLN